MQPPKPKLERLGVATASDGRTISLTQEQLDRAWSSISADQSGCWLWTGSRTSAGYGRLHIAGIEIYAHRLVYMISVGPIAAGFHIDHLCRTPPCCNPEHLEPVTPRENTMRSPIAVASVNAGKTQCSQGHLLSGSNLRVDAHGGRQCRTCGIAASRRGYAAATGAPLNTAPIDLDADTAPRRPHGADRCAKGHALDSLNTYVDPKGYKHCRACRTAARSRHEARKKDQR